jgi:hypothetical protein
MKKRRNKIKTVFIPVILLILAASAVGCNQAPNGAVAEQNQTANSVPNTEQTTNGSPKTNAASNNDGVTTVALNKTLDEFVAEQKKEAALQNSVSSNTQESNTVQESSISQADSNSSPANISDTNVQVINKINSKNPQAPSFGPTLDIYRIKHLDIKSATNRGKFHLDYHAEKNGDIHLNGEIWDSKIDIKGKKAEEMMNVFLNRFGLSSTLQQMLTNPGTNVEVQSRLPINEIKLETIDGEKIELHKKEDEKRKHEKK